MKLIAEPWDVGPGGYQVGNFPVLWSEWNGIYRDTMRDFWRGQASVGEFASRLSGSADLYEADGRDPFASINFITAHDGFTLADLVSYNEKHNEANLEDNRDGTDDNRSWNCGVEGETDDPEILALRAPPAAQLPDHAAALPGHADAARRRRARPHPARQQQRLVPGQRDLAGTTGTRTRARPSCTTFTRRLIALRREHPVFRRESFLRGQEVNGSGLPDVWWFRPDGRKMTRRDWQHGERGARDVPQRATRSRPRARTARTIDDDSFLVLFNAHDEDRDVHAAAPAVRRAAGSSSCRPPTPARQPGSASYGAQDRGHRDRALDRDPEAGRRERAPRPRCARPTGCS